MYQTEKLLREEGEQITGDERDQVESKVADLKSALEGDDLEAIRSATDELMSASHGFTQRLYEQASEAARGPGPEADAASGPDDDEVVDAEIVDEEDKEAS